MRNYYENIYLAHKARNPNKTPAPKNFWPYSFQFYMCNPIKTFSCIITNANTEPSISIDYFLDPKANRADIESESMPYSLLNKHEKSYLTHTYPTEIKNITPFVTEKMRGYLRLRDTDIISEAKMPYIRGQ